MTTPPPYRREIDGLRAIAVLAVVFYHFAIPGFGGGFVGVDVFFVISGFLIGGILWRELVATGRLSLARFYTRRLRRLAPAFVIMALVSGLAAWFILLPFEFREFGKALIASTLYFSNIIFYRQSGYFDGAADEKLLLHTWSLSVEEQFYIFLPITFILLARWRRHIPALLALLFAGSLAANLWFTPHSPTATFFLFPFRAWEMLAGVLLAIHGQKTGESWRHGAAPSWLGLALVLAGILFIQPDAGFPGWQVLAPVTGTALLLWNGRDPNPVNRLLSARLPVFIGLISYSLYLWHWPVMVLSKYYRDGYGTVETLFWIALALGLATLSWRFVERPVRLSNIHGWPLAGAVVVASGSLLAFGGAVYLQNGMPDRFGPQTRMHIDASADFLQDWSRCYWPDSGPFQGVEICPIGPKGPPEVLVWGDSHVRAFQAGIALAAEEHKRPGLLIWHAGCPPLFGISKTESAATPQEDAACTDTLNRIQTALQQVPTIRKLLVIGRWAYYANGQGVGNDAQNTIALHGKDFDTAVNDTFTALAQQFDTVFVLRQVPEIPLYDSRRLARLMAHGRIDDTELHRLTTVPRSQVLQRVAKSEPVFKSLATEGKIRLLDPWDMFCASDTCSAIRDGKALFFDNNHVVNNTGLMLRRLFDPVFAP